MVTAASPSFCAASIDAGAAAALVFHLVVEIGDLEARARSVAISFFRLEATLS